MPFLRKVRGLLGGGYVTGIFRLFRLRFPTYIFADLPNDHGLISNHTGDQPYWGKWNFWPDDVEDLLPGGEFQDRENPAWKENSERYVTSMAEGRYSTLQTKDRCSYGDSSIGSYRDAGNPAIDEKRWELVWEVRGCLTTDPYLQAMFVELSHDIPDHGLHRG